jgi:peptidoglycan/LPS O-acetylase OafA/YrhL
MSYVYQRTFSAGVTWIDFKTYLISRFARLYPVHVLTFLMVFLAVTPLVAGSPLFDDYAGRFSWIAAVANVFMLHGPWIDHRTWNYPSWSISAEMHVYLLLPLLTRIMLTKAYAAVALGVCVPGALLIYLSGIGYETFPTNGIAVLLRAGCLFVAGMAAYTLKDSAAYVGNVTALGILTVLFSLLSFENAAPFAVLLTPFLVIGTLGSNFLNWVLIHPWALYLGRISYSVYMIHAVVQILFVDRIRNIVGTQTSMVAATLLLVFAIMVSIVAADLLNRYVEVPGREKLRRLLLSRKTGVSA